MHRVDSLSLKTYVEDKFIKMPRFQLAKTWNEKQKFELTLSIFKQYPLGCVILCTHRENNGECRWLIDGRQRFTTIKDVLYNQIAYMIG